MSAAIAAAKEIKVKMPELNPVKYQLKNGLTVILKEEHNAPVITVHCFVNAGSITEKEYSGSGISHYVEHMLFKGTAKRPVGQIGREIKDIGGNTNAYTSFDRTVYFITASSGHINNILDIMSDVLFSSSFDKDETVKEQEVILKEINMQDDSPGSYMSRLVWDAMYKVHPYGMPVIGYADIFKSINREDLLKYYRRMYVPNNMVLVVVGDFKTEETKDYITKYFGGYERKAVEVSPIAQEPQQLAQRDVRDEFDINASYLFMGYHGPDIYSDDMCAMDALAIILGQGDTSRLVRDIKEKKQKVYSISSWSYTPMDPGVFGIDAELDEKNIEIVKSEILCHIKKIKEGAVSREELDRAAIKTVNEHIFSLQTVEGLARNMGSDETYTHSLEFSNNYIRKIQKLKPEDITRVANKYLREDTLTTVVLVPKKSGQQAVYDKKNTGTLPEIKKIVLRNGIRLLIREDHRLPVVAVRAVLQGGLRAEDVKNNGICNLMKDVMLKGTRKRTAEQLSSIIESRGIALDSFSGSNSFGLSCNMISNETETGLEILSDVLLNPSFPENEIAKSKELIYNSIRTSDDNILDAAKKLLKKTMFKEHPYSFLEIGEEESVKNITRNDIDSFYKTLVVPENLVIAVYGDIETDSVPRMIEKLFRFSSGGNGVSGMTTSKADFPADIRKEFKKVDKKQTVVFAGFKGVDLYNKDRYAIEMLGSILNNQGGRLFESIRDRQALAYMVGTFNIIGVDTGAFVFYAVTEKDKKEKAMEGILAEIKKLKNELIGGEELKRAKAELTGRYANEIQTSDGVAFKTSLDELYGIGYNDFLNYCDRINAVKAEDIKRIALNYFDTSRYALIEVGN